MTAESVRQAPIELHRTSSAVVDILRGTERGSLVPEWPADEIEFHRNGDWIDFIDRHARTRDIVYAKAAAAIDELYKSQAPDEALLTLAIADPGHFLARGSWPNGDRESISRWSARAVLHVLAGLEPRALEGRS